jgi:phosphoenolpyruvate carboxykinase (ATP)
MLAKRLEEHKDTTSVYLINTGWTGGPYGVGQRFDIQDTRYMVWAALNGDLDKVNFYPHPIFKVLIPESIPNVDPKILNPKNTWSDPEAYDRQAKLLAEKFIQNFKRFKTATPEIINAGPQLDG